MAWRRRPRDRKDRRAMPWRRRTRASRRREMDARHDGIGLDHEVVFWVGGEEGVVALEIAGAGETAGQGREVAGYQLELADAPGARHRPAIPRARRLVPGVPLDRAPN